MDNSDKIILDLCGGTGAWSKPYKDAGYDVRVITLPEYDVMTYEPPENVYGILAAPPCTHFSYMKNNGTAKIKSDLREGMIIVRSCLEIIWACRYYPTHNKDNSLKFWALENPANGYLKQFLGKPAITFQPFEYGDRWTKRTSLWGNFVEPVKKIVKPISVNPIGRSFDKDYKPKIPDNYIIPRGIPKRKVLRSITPPGFAKAFFEANR